MSELSCCYYKQNAAFSPANTMASIDWWDVWWTLKPPCYFYIYNTLISLPTDKINFNSLIDEFTSHCWQVLSCILWKSWHGITACVYWNREAAMCLSKVLLLVTSTENHPSSCTVWWWWWWWWYRVCGDISSIYPLCRLFIVSVQGWVADGCPAVSMSCPLRPPRGADWACSAPPGPPIGQTDAGCSLWAAAPARTPRLTGWRPAAQPEGPVTRLVVKWA